MPATAPGCTWAGELRKEPSTAPFHLVDDHLVAKLDVPEGLRPAVEQLVAEIVDWWLVRYLDDLNARQHRGTGHDDGDPPEAPVTARLKVAQAKGGKAMLFLRRDQNPPLPSGPIEVLVDGEPHTAKLVEVACNVLTRPGSTSNRLAEVLRGWFGPDAGATGTHHQVELHRDTPDQPWQLRDRGALQQAATFRHRRPSMGRRASWLASGQPDPLCVWQHPTLRSRKSLAGGNAMSRDSTYIDLLRLDPISPTPDGSAIHHALPCSTPLVEPSHEHPIAVEADWSWTVLEHGGRSGLAPSCIDEIDAGVRKLSRVIQRLWRRDVPVVRRGNWGRLWTLQDEEPHCSNCMYTDRPESIGRHSRQLHHLNSRPEAGFARTSESEAQRSFVDAVKSRHSTDLTTPPASYDHVVIDDDGAALLWDCGVHPEHVLRLHDALKLDATPLPGRFYLHVVAFRPDLGWLRHSLDNRRSTSMAAWLAATETGRDRAEPSLRHDWLAAGVPQRTIVPLTEAGFSPDDVRRLARHTGRPMDSAAIVFHRWVETLCPLDVDDLVRLHDLGVQLTFKPSSGALHTLAFDHKQELEGVSRRELGLLYAVAGTTRTTRLLISSGIRTPEEAVRYLQSAG